VYGQWALEQQLSDAGHERELAQAAMLAVL